MTTGFPVQENLSCRTGDTWAAVFYWRQESREPFNLTGYTARMMLRKQFESPAPAVSLSTNSGGGISIDGPAGKIFCTLTPEQTSALLASPYLYDLELTSPAGTVTTLAAGRFEVQRDVSR